MKRVLVLGMIVFAAALSYAVWRVFLRPRDGGFGPVGGIKVVAKNVYLIPDGGGNSAAFITSHGVVLVDTKVANQGPGILEQIKKVTDQPVTFIINTHSHGDHTGSNLYFPPQVEIVSHENTAKNMKKMSNFLFGWKKDALPDRTFGDKLTLFSGADSIDLYYFGPAHTDGDTFVVFRDAQVMHAGDVFASKGIPRIDTGNGGSGLQFATTMRRAATDIHDVRTVISGHSGAISWREFVEYADFTESLVEAARNAHDAGQSVEQASQEFHLSPDKYKGYDLTAKDGMFMTVYAELPNREPGGWERAAQALSSIVATVY